MGKVLQSFKKLIYNLIPYGIIKKRKAAKSRKEKRKKAELKRIKQLEKEKEKAQKAKEKFLNSKKTKSYSNHYSGYHYEEPIEQNWVLYEAHTGIGMVCNPYAIFKAFMQSPDFDKYIHIWVIMDEDEMNLLKEEYAEYNNVVFVYYQSKAYSYFLAKSKYLINNTSFGFAFTKREEQIFVNTWHGITIKTLGYDCPDGARVSANMIRNFLMSDYIIQPEEFMVNIFDESFRLKNIFKGKYIQDGYPRNDLVLKTDKDYICDKLEKRGTHIDKNKKTILYAPTWFGNAANNPYIDMSKYTDIYAYLKSHVDTDQYNILIKPHHVVYRHLSEEEKNSGIYVSYSIDTNELLSVVDILITDYSSIFFDYMVADKPILFYIPDYKEYEEKRGIYFKPDELPGPCLFDLKGVADSINNIDSCIKEYADKRHKMMDWACPYDDGKVSEKIIDIVFNKNEKPYRIVAPKQENKKRILIYPGNLKVNGVTSAAISLLKKIDYSKYDVTAFFIKNNDPNSHENFDKIPGEVRSIIRCSPPSLCEEQMDAYRMMLKDGFDIPAEKQEMQNYIIQKEYIRCLGNTDFDIVIDFSGYSALFPCLVAEQNKNAKKMIWQHSDLLLDFTNSEKRQLNSNSLSLNGLLSVYEHFDKIVSASKDIFEINRNNLSNERTFDKFTYSTNIIDEKRIADLSGETAYCTSGEKEFIKLDSDISKNGIETCKLIPIFKKNENTAIFCTMGRCMPEKNHENIIRAVKMLRDEGKDVCLYIIGDGHLRPKLEALINELGLRQYVIITGFLDNPFAIMKESNCFVFPSEYEAQGLAVLEARMVKLPIIVNNYPAVNSVVLEDKQYIMDNPSVDSICRAMHAYLDNQIKSDYEFDLTGYNKTSFSEFEQLLEQ